jgi:hypothetical protein
MHLYGPSLAAACCAVLISFDAGAQECPAIVWMDSFVTSKGLSVELPDIGTLTCDEIVTTLSKIDSTRYRENGPRPADPADTPLYCYEKKLAQVNYEVCIIERRQSAAPPVEALRQQAEKQ